MIRITRFNGSALYVNADLVESVEATPDTVVTLIDGKRFVVRDSVEDVVGAFTAFRAAVLALADAAGHSTHPRPSGTPPLRGGRADSL